MATRHVMRKCCLCQDKRDDCCWHESLQGFVCPLCTVYQQDYSIANATLVGFPLKHLPAFSLEFEVSSRNRKALDNALILLKYQYKRTSDGTVDDEYKSPIYQNLRAFRKPLTVLHDLRDLVNERCGTHLHVACTHKERLRAVHSEVFSPLLNHMLNHSEQTTRFWGRFFSRFATAPNSSRYHCFNLDSRYPTLEFRLPRFKTAGQYLKVVQYCRRTVGYLDKTLTEDLQMEAFTNPSPDQLKGVSKKRIVSPTTLGKHVLLLYKQHVKVLPEREIWLDEEPVEDVFEEEGQDSEEELFDLDDDF